MPNAAQQNNQWVTYTDDHLKNLQQSVTSNLQQAGVSTDYEAVKPIHVPDGQPHKILDQVKIDTEKMVPESFDSTPKTTFTPLKALSEHLDYADQLVTGRSHVVGEAQGFTLQKNEKEQRRLDFANQPHERKKNWVANMVDWFYDEDQRTS